MPLRDPPDREIADSLACDAPTARRLIDRLSDRPGVRAVVFYGSRFAGGAAADSELDFFVVADSLRRYSRTIADWLLGLVLPPSTYHFRPDASAGTPGAKLCVISTAQLVRETSPSASDLYHLGRFSKRVGLIHADGGEAASLIARSRRSALTALLPHALAKVERHTGRPLPLSARARRHPLLLGWPHLRALRQRQLLK